MDLARFENKPCYQLRDLSFRGFTLFLRECMVLGFSFETSGIVSYVRSIADVVDLELRVLIRDDELQAVSWTFLRSLPFPGLFRNIARGINEVPWSLQSIQSSRCVSEIQTPEYRQFGTTILSRHSLCRGVLRDTMCRPMIRIRKSKLEIIGLH